MNRSYADRVTVYLALESVETPSSNLTEMLAMHPDRQWVLGETRGRTGKRCEHHGWSIESTARSHEHGGQPASQLLPIALETFQEKAGPVVNASSTLGPSVERYVVLAILAEEVPGIELSHSFLQLLVRLGGTFQVDLTLLPAAPPSTGSTSSG